MMEDGIINNYTIPRDIINAINKKNEKNIKIERLNILEKKEIEKAIELFGDTTEGKKKAAEALGIGIATLYRKL